MAQHCRERIVIVHRRMRSDVHVQHINEKKRIKWASTLQKCKTLNLVWGVMVVQFRDSRVTYVLVL